MGGEIAKGTPNSHVLNDAPSEVDRAPSEGPTAQPSEVNTMIPPFFGVSNAIVIRTCVLPE